MNKKSALFAGLRTPKNTGQSAGFNATDAMAVVGNF